ncbi:hypothetical protein ACFU8T_13215 [Sphingobacterium spiritivorum]|nr:hypothetical protein [Sphingobacterium spiritivorum]QQT34497.1 hypothetical protein I6J01_14355 [Sphingobacterium spiritivorum]WQD35356.1 hypothetical protein U0038_06290 [Sphingobacterium spiritivorum]
MKKQNIQDSNYPKRESNFLTTITSEDTFQVIIDNAGSSTLLLWQDEYYMEAYLSHCEIPITLSKVDSVIFLKMDKRQPSGAEFLYSSCIWTRIP